MASVKLIERYQELRKAVHTRVFSHLNPQQLEAVTNGKGPLLCLAGAGSGKTTAMVSRILHLLLFGPHFQEAVIPPFSLNEEDIQLMDSWLKENEEKVVKFPQRLRKLLDFTGVHPGNILAITFTNKAAQEMQHRLALLLGEGVNDLWVMTFHAACVRILRREISVLSYTGDFGIYDASDQLVLVKAVMKELNLDEKKFNPRAILQGISRFKCELIEPAEARKAAAGDYFLEKVGSVYQLYQKRLQENNALDFDDLLMCTVKILKNYPDIRAKYQQRFQYIMVDEYQDTNRAQYVLVNLLAEKHHNLCVVGDDDQSIYGFRQADIRNILDFERDYPEAKVIKLEENYRSSQCILDAANEVIRNNRGRKEKRLWTRNREGERIVKYRAHNEQDEARFVSEQINELVKDNRYQDFAVLMRTNAQSRVLEEWFMRRGIPYRVIGGFKFYERKEIKDILAYLKFLVNPQDSVSLQRIINVPRRGIGEATIEKVAQHASLKGLTFYEALKEYAKLEFATKAGKAITLFISKIEEFKEKAQNLTVTELTEKILLETGYWSELEKENSIESQSRMENLKEFLGVTKEYAPEKEDYSLADFLALVSLVTDLDTYEDETNAVVVMTMHMAKGLEFANVFVIGMEEGIFPHARSLLESKELEEERRLCYVALTRAKERIFLIHARERNLFGKRSINQPSRFLTEIPQNLWQEYPQEDFFKTTPVIKAIPSAPTGEISDYNLGDKVEHKKWGQGVIVGCRGEGEEKELQIAFPEQGIKTLLAKYAPISKI